MSSKEKAAPQTSATKSFVSGGFGGNTNFVANQGLDLCARYPIGADDYDIL